MTGWTILWLVWLAGFLAIELPAVFNKQPGDTLSEHVWKWFSIKGKPKGYKVRRLGFLVFWAWLTVHFFFGGWV